MSLSKACVALVTFGVLLLPQLVLSQSVVVTDEPSASSSIAEQFENHRALVEELELRRRVNVLFPNPQSLFDGFQVGLVNVGSGNLTFLRRDLVMAAFDPIVFGRVYDSRIDHNPDFGTGWRISLVEELRPAENGSLVYVDSSGTHHHFQANGSQFVPVNATVELSGTFLTVGGEQAVLRDGENRFLTFQKFPESSSLFLVKVEVDHAPVTEYRYSGGMLSSVHEDDERLLKVNRNASGMVESISDKHGRSVQYRYDSRGRLTEVQDLAGYWWRHDYDENGKLTSMVGGNGKRVLSASYHDDGRILSYQAGRAFEFRYSGESTEVSDHTGQTHTFTQNKHGATTSWQSSYGRSWRIDLDERNRVTSIEGSNGSRKFTYNQDGSIASTMDHDRGPTVYGYDEFWRLSTVSNPDNAQHLSITYDRNATSLSDSETGAQIEYEMRHGQVISLRDEAGWIDVERNQEGYIIGLQDASGHVVFERDDLQRLVATHYPSGFTSRYAYDLLGNRNWVLHSVGSSVHYRHDAAGNIVQVTVSDGNGKFKRQTVEIGEMNQVDRIVYGDDRSVSVSYDGQSRPIRFDMGYDEISIAYSQRDGSMHMTSRNSGLAWQGDMPVPRTQDIGSRAEVLKRTTVNHEQAGHRVLHFNEWTFEAEFVDPLNLELPGLNEARAILQVAAELLRTASLESEIRFEKPSNPIFQPNEYRSTNCCIPCSINVCQECSISGSRASWWLCFCQSETLWYSYAPSSPDIDEKILEIIQEYVEHGKTPPAYEEFTKTASTEHFTATEYNSGDYEYFVAGKMLELAEKVRAEYNAEIDDDPNTDYGLVVISGYRNPAKNLRIRKTDDSADNSRHMWGDAIDLKVPADDLPPNLTEDQAADFLFKEVAEPLYRGKTGYYVYKKGNVVHVGYTP